jgi:predicted nucleic acid-binding protein
LIFLWERKANEIIPLVLLRFLIYFDDKQWANNEPLRSFHRRWSTGLMKTLKIYLDTSVISHLYAQDVPDKMADTLKLWAEIQAGNYNIILSEITISELDACQEPKRSDMYSALANIDKTIVSLDDEAIRLADLYVSLGGLTIKNIVDARHIAIATINACDIIATWNFKHMINFNAIRVVEAVNRKESYGIVHILSPASLLTF